MIQQRSFRKLAYRIILGADTALAAALVCFQPQLSAFVPQPALAALACGLWLLAVLLFHLSTLVDRKP